MGSFFETNDTLQLTRVQGFPTGLDFAKHQRTPYPVKDFAGKVFSFSNKPGLRIFHTPPTRVFLVENRNGKWLYWGVVHVLEVTHDYKKKTTSGKFKIIKLFSPEDLRKAYNLVVGRVKKNFFE